MKGLYIMIEKLTIDYYENNNTQKKPLTLSRTKNKDLKKSCMDNNFFKKDEEKKNFLKKCFNETSDCQNRVTEECLTQDQKFLEDWQSYCTKLTTPDNNKGEFKFCDNHSQKLSQNFIINNLSLNIEKNKTTLIASNQVEGKEKDDNHSEINSITPNTEIQKDNASKSENSSPTSTDGIYTDILLVLAGLLVGYIIGRIYPQTQKTDVQKSSNNSQEFKNDSQEINKITLALVLTGKEVAKIQSQTLKQSDLQSLLEKSSYLLCVPQAEINATLNTLSFGKDRIDSNSEQQKVLVRIDFNHTLPLPQSTFRNKLEFNNFLRKGSNITFNIKEKLPLTKISGFSQAGFIRT